MDAHVITSGFQAEIRTQTIHLSGAFSPDRRFSINQSEFHSVEISFLIFRQMHVVGTQGCEDIQIDRDFVSKCLSAMHDVRRNAQDFASAHFNHVITDFKAHAPRKNEGQLFKGV